MSFNYEIMRAGIADWDDAMQLAWDTFMKFEADEYGAEGEESFFQFIHDPILRRKFILGEYIVFVAKDEDKIIGIISMRNRVHVSLLFVDEAYHHKGIGGQLIHHAENFVQNEYAEHYITVNAAPYAIGFYHQMGFVDVAPQLACDGITYTPMEKMI